jgi:hypothetical protein
MNDYFHLFICKAPGMIETFFQHPIYVPFFDLMCHLS